MLQNLKFGPNIGLIVSTPLRLSNEIGWWYNTTEKDRICKLWNEYKGYNYPVLIVGKNNSIMQLRTKYLPYNNLLKLTIIVLYILNEIKEIQESRHVYA